MDITSYKMIAKTLRIPALVILFSFAYGCHNKFIPSKKREHARIEQRNFYITDKENVKHKIHYLSIEAFNAYKTEGIKQCLDLQTRHNIKAYETKRKNVIVERDGEFLLYPSIDLVMELIDRNKNAPTVAALLYGLNPYGQSFPKYVDSMIISMLSDLNIDRNNQSHKQVLEQIDSVIYNKRDKVLFKKHFLSFIGVIGDFIIKEYNGEWIMSLSSRDKVTWTPSLMVNGKQIFYEGWLFQDFYDQSEKNPLTEVYETIRGIIKMNVKTDGSGNR